MKTSIISRHWITRFAAAGFGAFVALSASAGISGPVTVGVHGNEPIVTKAPDGTLYISALQHIYRSTNSGASWTELAGPIYAQQINLNSDSSIAVDPGNRLYFTFDYPYAGTTAVCTSDDHGDTWTCNPSVVPGGTDRMWVLAPSLTTAFEVTNEGLYETSFLESTDRGLTWTAKSLGAGILEPQTGPLLQQNCSSDVLQVTKIYGTTPQETPELKFYVYHPGATGSVIADVRSTGLPLPVALPSASLGLDNELWVASEEVNAASGRQIVVARSTNAGQTWTKLPPIPDTTTGTATFSWVAAGAPHHVGVLYYYTADNGDPGTLTNSTWSVRWAESFNADNPVPTWTVTTIENAIHTGAICVSASCTGSQRFSGDFITAIIDSAGAAHLTWVKQDNAGATSIRYAQVQSGAASTYSAIPCALVPSAVVSRKMHGKAGTFDIPLPQIGAAGIECRSGGSGGNHQIVATFPSAVTFDHAAVTSGTGSVASANASGKTITINLAGVKNAQTLTVTLFSVSDGTSTANVPLQMSVLYGDTNGDSFVNSADVSQTKSQSGSNVSSANFREDVTADGSINSADVSLVKSKSGTALP